MSLGGRPFDFPNLWSSPRGTTGSEISLLCYAREMAKRGHDVALYVDKANAEEFEGVRVVERARFQAEAPGYDVAYSWNEPEELRGVPASVLRVVNQQLNDWSYCKPGYDDHVDLYTSPSQNHLERVGAKVPSGLAKWIVVPNGCYPEAYDLSAKVPGRVVHTSSPDRGLHLLLSVWPRIRKAVPHATLRIFYFSLQRWLEAAADHETSIYPDVAEHARRARYISNALRFADRLGIEVVGSVSRDQMARELSQAEVLGFPCDTIAYTEGFSVATLEGCASGALPIVSDVDALGEIYGGHVSMVTAPARAHMDEWASLAIRALTDQRWRAAQVETARALASKYAWPVLTARLDNHLSRLLAERSYAAAPRARQIAQTDAGVIGHLPNRSYRTEHRSPAVQTSGPTIHMVLTEAAASNQTIDVRNLMADHFGGGARAGFLGLAAALPKCGYRVRAFGPFKAAAEIDGVSYELLAGHTYRFNKPDVLLAYYDTSPLVGVHGPLRIASHHTYQPYPGPTFDWHDVNTAPSEVAMAHLRRCYEPWSPWHVLPNGVGDIHVERKPVSGRVIYHTSASRGLHHLVGMWPEIKRAVPHATLHIVGNLDEWMDGPYGDAKLAHCEQGRRVQALRKSLPLAHRSGGVKVLGTLSRTDLLRELAEASCFAFPASSVIPCETFSVSIMECCKIGLPVVLAPADALGSIYDGYVRMTRAPVEDYLGEFRDAVVEMLTDEDEQVNRARSGLRLAERFTFANQAAALDAIIREHLPKRESAKANGHAAVTQ